MVAASTASPTSAAWTAGGAFWLATAFADPVAHDHVVWPGRQATLPTFAAASRPSVSVQDDATATTSTPHVTDTEGLLRELLGDG